MVKVFRVAMVVLAVAALYPPEIRAEAPLYCQVALQRCLNQCKLYPEIFREGCMIGCGIGFLGCGD